MAVLLLVDAAHAQPPHWWALAHRAWGVVRCPAGEHVVAVWSTPQDPGILGKRIREQVAKCRHREEAKS